jgi:hypothetical protein
VRLRAGAIRGVEVPSLGDARSLVARGNCAAARRGGEQPEAMSLLTEGKIQIRAKPRGPVTLGGQRKSDGGAR